MLVHWNRPYQSTITQHGLATFSLLYLRFATSNIGQARIHVRGVAPSADTQEAVQGKQSCNEQVVRFDTTRFHEPHLVANLLKLQRGFHDYALILR